MAAMTKKKSRKQARRPYKGRRQASPSPDDWRVHRGIARRSDSFAHPEEDDATSTITYASGTSEGWIRLIQPDGGLDAHSLALFSVLCEWFLAKSHIRRITLENGEPRWALQARPRELALAIYGRADGREYRSLGLQRNDVRHRGALQRLNTVTIEVGSQWLDSDGKRRSVQAGFHLIDTWRWDTDASGNAQVTIVLSAKIQGDLVQGHYAVIPSPLVRALGPKRETALRVAYHVLSHAPVYGSTRKLGVGALVPIVAPDPSRDPQNHRGRFLGYFRRLVDALEAADPKHTWHWEASQNQPLGVVICQDR